MFRHGFLETSAYENRGVLDRLKGKESDFIKHIDKLTALSKAVKQGEFNKVLDIYYRLPPSLQNEQTLLVFRARAAYAVSEDEYAKAVTAFEKIYPDHPAVLLLSIETNVEQKHFDEALNRINRLDKKLGGDPYLELRRAGVHIAATESQESNVRCWELRSPNCLWR